MSETALRRHEICRKIEARRVATKKGIRMFLRLALPSSRRRLGALVLGLILVASAAAQTGVQALGAVPLRARHAALGPQLATNQFGRPLYLESVEASRSIQGDIYAVVEYPFAAVSAALNDPDHWCDVMILHLNTKFCRRKTEDGATRLEMRLGKKYDQPVEDASLLSFAYRAVAVTPEYLDIELDAPDGPFATKDYRMVVEAVAIGAGRTFIHMGYAFGYGTGGRLAMSLYLATVGAGKIGFTTTAAPQAGVAPQYIGGMRGVVERNTMRYYLAIEAYLAGLAAPPAQQAEKRFQLWFDATEKYAPQLHEVERDGYLSMKRGEYQRQQAKP